MTFQDAAQVKYIPAGIIRNQRSPFNIGEPIKAQSTAGGTLYGVNRPGSDDTEKYQAIVWGVGQDNFIFELPSELNVAVNSATTVDQLRAVALLDGEPLLRVDGDTLPAVGEWCVATGGGTGVGATGIQIDTGATEGDESIQIRHTAMETGVETILIGDVLTIAGTEYTVVSNFTFDDDTPVEIFISPALAATAAGDTAVTIAAGTGQTVILGTLPVDDQILELFVFDAADVKTFSGGALTAGRETQDVAYEFMYSADNVTIIKI